MNSPRIPEQAINPPDIKPWPEYDMQEAKLKAMKRLYKSADGRDLAADIVTNVDTYKDSCEFWNTIAFLLYADTDKEVLNAASRLTEWFMSKSDKTVTAMAEIYLAEDAAYDSPN